MSLGHIPRIPAKTAPYFFDEFYCSELPVIITGLARTWPCDTKWTIDYLKSVIGGRKLSISMDVAGYLELVAAAEAGGKPAFPAPPSATEHLGPIGGTLAEDYGIKSLFPEPDAYSFSSFLFCSVPATKTHCHYDWTHNFVGVIRGVQHVTLLPPKSEQHMVVSDDLREKMAAGGGDYFDDPPDLDLGGGVGRPMHEHPVFAHCPHVYTGTLAEGDVVFFPAYWYHYFHNVTASITVTTQSCAYDG